MRKFEANLHLRCPECEMGHTVICLEKHARSYHVTSYFMWQLIVEWQIFYWLRIGFWGMSTHSSKYDRSMYCHWANSCL